MAMSLKDFLTLYFRQLHFDSMPPAVRARFDQFVDRNDLVGDMPSWVEDLLDRNADNKLYKDKTGHYAHKPLPNAETELNDEDWEEFYRILHNVFASMDMDRGSLKKKPEDFLDKYFGDGKVFGPVPLVYRTENLISTFRRDILEDDAGFALFRAYAGVENPRQSDYEKFKESVRKGEYASNADVRSKLTRMVNSLQNVDLTEYQGFQDVGNKLNTFAHSGGLIQILNGLSQEKEPTHSDIAKLKSRYAEILKAIHDDKKVAEDFKRFDNGNISGPLDTAIEKTDYTGEITKKDKVPELIEDRKTFGKRVGEKAQNLYDDVFKKWLTLHPAHVYAKETTAKPIVEVMTSKDFNLKPTDGIKAMLDKADAITGKLQEKSPKATEHFEWFKKTLASLSKTDSFEGALRNRRELRKLVANIWEKAVADGKLDEAETTMEVLKVMSYDLLSSRRLDKIRSADFTFFSDPKASYMQAKGPGSEAAQALAKGADFVLKGTLFVTGYTVAAAVNLARRIGTGPSRADKKKYLRANEQDEKIIAKNNEDRETIKEKKAELAGLTAGTDEYDAIEAEIEKIEERIEKRSEKLKPENRNRDIENAKDQERLEAAQEQQDGLDPASDEYQELAEEISFLNDSIGDRNTAFEKKSDKEKEAYARLMGFWRYLQTGHTKTFFRISTKRVQRKRNEKMQKWIDKATERYEKY